MCRMQCVLALAALYVGLVHSWDIAVSVGDELIFYTDGRKTNTVKLISQNPTALAYDEDHHLMLYVDKQSDNNDAICGYNLLSKENKCFIKRVGSNIHSIAFDPATNTLFFTDTNERSINWISLKPGSINNVHGNLLIKMDDRTPSDIAVDSCRGYIYWTNTNITKKEYIERAQFDGSEREVIKQLFPVYSMTIDPQTRKIYYIDGSEPGFLNSEDLDGTRINECYVTLSATYLSEPKDLTVSNDYLYWINNNGSYRTVWCVPKNAISFVRNSISVRDISQFHNESPLGITANYKIKNQIQGLQDCEVLSSLIPNITVTNYSLNTQQTTETSIEYTTVAELLCIHGINVSETSVCKCILGYIGERCDISVCENYCLEGDCSLNNEGLPKCRCNAGYSGERCEEHACHGFCLNNGDCSLNEKNEPVCQCKRDYVGDRCELSNCLNYCIQGECSFNEEGLPTCRCNAGYSGERCEVYACYGYCLNNGDCSLNEEDKPVCQCVGNHKGTRCEAVKDVTINNIPTYDSAKRNLTLADLLLNWRKPSSKMFVTIEV